MLSQTDVQIMLSYNDGERQIWPSAHDVAEGFNVNVETVLFWANKGRADGNAYGLRRVEFVGLED